MRIARGRTGWRCVAALAWTCLASPALCDPAQPADQPPVCAGRDLTREAALHPEALAGAYAQRRDALDNAQGLLWRIEMPPAPPSYLFGTIHATDDRATALAKAAAAHITGAKVVVTELGGPFDAYAMATMGAGMMAKALARDTDTLAGLGSPEDVATVEKYLAGRGVPPGLAHHLRLWFLATLSAAPACEAQRQQRAMPIVDQVIAEAARTLGVEVVGLETAAEQTDALSSLDPALAATALLTTARRPDLADDVYATLLDLYAAGRPGEILPVVDASRILTPHESAAEDDMTRRLLGDRNRIMAERMTPLIEKGGAFVAVGALHLVGKGGLIELLRARGFSVIEEH